MAIQTGNIKYRGSFKSIRNYVQLHDSNTYAGEKGGANRDLIMNNPAFARTRENMNEFAGCGLACKAIRKGLTQLLPDQTDSHFSGRLIRLIKMINRHDIEGERGKRSIIFSSAKPLLLNLKFNLLQPLAELKSNFFTATHPVSRAEATLKVTDFKLKKTDLPFGAIAYRLLNHISAISDYSYSEVTRQYESLDPLNSKGAFIYSEYTPVETALTVELKAEFPVGTLVGEDCTILQCVGIEFYLANGTNKYLPAIGNSIVMIDVF